MTGRWVNRGGIKVFVETEPTPPMPTAWRDPADFIACPTCHARLAEHCRTRSGRHRAPHKTRLVSRRCPCGESLLANKKLCDDCRDAARRENGRRGMAATRARRRAVA